MTFELNRRKSIGGSSVQRACSIAQQGKMQSKSRIHADPSPYQDHFDQIPDSLVLLIFNKLADIRSLGRCLAVSKRFNILVPLVHDVYVRIDRVVSVDGDSDEALTLSSPKPRNFLAHLLKLMLFAILKPFQHLQNFSAGHKPLLPHLSHHSPAQVLKNFTHVRNLRIELPAGDVGTEDGVVLKWRAEFGSTLHNCVILGGTKLDRRPSSANLEGSVEDTGSIPEPFYTNGGLKLRVVWTISSLVAASTRHYLLRQIIRDHPSLRSLVLTDADGQGTLTMGAEQLKEFREKPLAASASSNRTQVPASNMKLRYTPYLELPEGMALQGATLVAIKPAEEGTSSGNCSRKDAEAFVCGAFDGPFQAAVKALLKRRTYLLEMNVDSVQSIDSSESTHRAPIKDDKPTPRRAIPSVSAAAAAAAAAAGDAGRAASFGQLSVPFSSLLSSLPSPTPIFSSRLLSYLGGLVDRKVSSPLFTFACLFDTPVLCRQMAQETGHDLLTELRFMELALEQARFALENLEVPVGCVIVEDEKVIASGSNCTSATRNATRHAEMEAIDTLLEEWQKIGLSQSEVAEKFSRCDLYVTCEPCIMCATALSILGLLILPSSA
ncbi:hypothetical protein GW17_00002090 [Ensete ventricosum]|nr:hypothetical protein GW17_00002090 [Ensete ventricosum]